jgi:hypothetical protein
MTLFLLIFFLYDILRLSFLAAASRVLPPTVISLSQSLVNEKANSHPSVYLRIRSDEILVTFSPFLRPLMPLGA